MSNILKLVFSEIGYENQVTEQNNVSEIKLIFVFKQSFAELNTQRF